MKPVPFEAHRAPDPVPVDEPSDQPFDNPHPHHPPVHTPMTEDDEPPIPDPNPTTFI